MPVLFTTFCDLPEGQKRFFKSLADSRVRLSENEI